MKRKFILAFTSACFLIGFGTPLRYRENQKERQNTPNQHPGENKVSCFLKQLTSSSSLRFQNLDLKIEGRDVPFSLQSNDLAVTYLEDDKSLSGHLNLTRDTLNLPFGVYLNEKQGAIEYDSKIYKRSASSIGDRIGVLSSSGLIHRDTGSVLDSQNTLDKVNEILGKIQDGIYQSSDVVSSMDGSHTFTFDTDYGTLVRGADKNLLFTSVSTPNGLSFDSKDGTSKIKVTLNGNGEQSLKTSYVTSYDSSLESVNRDGLDPLFVTFVNRAKHASFAASLDFTRKDTSNADSLEKGFRIDALADLSDAQKVQAKISQGDSSNPYIKGQAAVYYEKEKTFINVNNQSKGHLTNQKVKDVIDALTHVSKSSDTTSLIENIASILSDCEFKKLLEGDYSRLTKLVSSISSNSDGTKIIIDISSKAFGLTDDPDAVSKITLDFHKDMENNENEIEQIKVENVPFKSENVSLCFKIDSFTPSFETIDEAEYQRTYDGILPAIKQLEPYLEKKQFGRHLSVERIEKGYTNEDGSYKTADFTGEARLDLTKENKPQIGASLAIQGSGCKKHNLDVRYLDDTAYRTLDKARKQSITKTEASSVFDALSEGIAKLTKSDDNTQEALNKILDKFASIFSLSNGLDLDTLFRFVLVKEESDENQLVLELDPSVIDTSFQKGGTLTRKLDENGLTSVSILGLGYEDIVFNISLNRKDYVSIKDRTYLDGSASFNTNDFVGKEVNQFSFFITGLFDLLPGNEKQFSAALSLTAKDRINTDSYPLGIDGNINFDYLNSQYAGELHIDRDEHSYDPSIDFYYSKNRVPYQNNIEDNLCVKYYHQDNKQTAKDTSYLGALRGNKAIEDRTSQIQEIKKTNLFYAYLGPIVQIYNRIMDKKDEVETSKDSSTPDIVSFLSLLDGIDSVDITSGQIHIVLENSLLSSSSSGTSDVIRRYQTTSETDWKITSIEFDSLMISSEEQADGSSKETKKQISGSLSLSDQNVDFDQYANTFNDDFKGKSIDFNSLPIRTSLLLNTTDQSDFYLSGTLNVDLKIVGIDSVSISADITAGVHVEKGTNGNKANVTGYILVDSGGTKTEYYIRPKTADCFIVKHYSNQTKVWLITQKQRTAHIGYYLCAIGLNFEAEQNGLGPLAWKSYLVEQIEKSSSSSDSDDSSDKGGIAGTSIVPEKRIKSMSYSEPDKKFSLNADLSSIDLGTSVISFTNTLPVEVTYDKDENGVNKLKTLSINQKSVIKILGSLATGDIEFNAALNSSGFNFLSGLRKVESYYYGKTGNKDDYYVVTGVSRKNKYKFPSWTYWIEATGTGTMLTIGDSNLTLPCVAK
ncbi:MAG: hypothetical protein SO286_04755 [Candidatus Enterosoma sp.]|nr:hypothetical protein [Candidatus Enterosoma sp.]